MTPTEKTAYAHRNAEAETPALAEAEAEALEAALSQLERSTSRTQQSLDAALAEVRAAMG